MEWSEFLQAVKDAGGSTDMQTSKTGRYPYLFHFQREQAHLLADVVIYPYFRGKYVDDKYVAGPIIVSPPRDWTTKEKLVADYRALREHGATFNDTLDALGER